METLKTAWELLWGIYEKVKGTPWESVMPVLVGTITIFLCVKVVIMPIAKMVVRIYEYISKKYFVKKQVYEGLSFMDSSDLYYAIKNYVPTRFSRIDPSNNEEPMPEYVSHSGEREPLLLEHFLKNEYSIKHGRKYYLCLGDCGMGKTTFLVNLYYRTLKLHKYNCVFVSLQEENCIEQIERVSRKGRSKTAKTILLLDALDENESALTDYDAFTTELERATRNFYRVIITARTNFFENESKEQISNNKSNTSMLEKISNSKKFYISPFTDEDIKKFLKRKYPFKAKRAWKVVEKNKNLSVRPLLLRFMDELLKEEKEFEYDFQLYEYLFGKWIEREKRGIDENLGEGLYEECLLMAKEIYYRWLKDGKIGIYANEMRGENVFAGIESIQLKGHALINRTSDGMYKFSHKSYWEFLLAKLAVSDYLFSDELLIRNFDRTTAFLKEMIEYEKDNKDIDFLLGKANYFLKYDKPEKAEELYRNVLNKVDEENTIYLFSLIKLGKSQWQQIKYKSARNTWESVFELIGGKTISTENINILSKFAIAFSSCCQVFNLSEGQQILEHLILYYEVNDIYNYNLLECYEAYSRCCINFKRKQDSIAKMEKIIELHYEKDQYAKYLYLCAISWKTLYKSQRLLEVLTQLNKQYTRFMDAFELIICNCDLAFSTCLIYNEQKVYNEHAKEVLGYFYDAYEVCNLIYPQYRRTGIENPYSAMIQKKMVQTFSSTNQKRVDQYIESIIHYARKYRREEEMAMFCCSMFVSAGRNRIHSFSEREAFFFEGIRLAKNNSYRIADICWDLYLLYDNDGRTELGQKFLKKAYDLAVSEENIYMTPLYCGILRVTLRNYQQYVDREEIVNKLLEVVPMIYGNDERRESVYEDLKEYFMKTKDERLLDVCTELLSLEINQSRLEELLRALDVNYIRIGFVRIIQEVIANKERLQPKEMNELEEFMDKNRRHFTNEDMNSYRKIIDKSKRRSKHI